MAQNIASIGNGGYKLNHLHLINKITDLKGNIVYESSNNINKEKILSDQTIKYSHQIYHQIKLQGIRKQLDQIPIKICCKTGTSQNNKESSFVVWDKNYLIYIMIYNIEDDNLLNNNNYQLWGNHIPLLISREILLYLLHINTYKYIK